MQTLFNGLSLFIMVWFTIIGFVLAYVHFSAPIFFGTLILSSAYFSNFITNFKK